MASSAMKTPNGAYHSNRNTNMAEGCAIDASWKKIYYDFRFPLNGEYGFSGVILREIYEENKNSTINGMRFIHGSYNSSNDYHIMISEVLERSSDFIIRLNKWSYVGQDVTNQAGKLTIRYTCD